MSRPQILRDVLLSGVYLSHPNTGKACRPTVAVAMDTSTREIVAFRASFDTVPLPIGKPPYGKPRDTTPIERWFYEFREHCEKQFPTYISEALDMGELRTGAIALPTLAQYLNKAQAYVALRNALLKAGA